MKDLDLSNTSNLDESLSSVNGEEFTRQLYLSVPAVKNTYNGMESISNMTSSDNKFIRPDKDSVKASPVSVSVIDKVEDAPLDSVEKNETEKSSAKESKLNIPYKPIIISIGVAGALFLGLKYFKVI